MKTDTTSTESKEPYEGVVLVDENGNHTSYPLHKLPKFVELENRVAGLGAINWILFILLIIAVVL